MIEASTVPTSLLGSDFFLSFETDPLENPSDSSTLVHRTSFSSSSSSPRLGPLFRDERLFAGAAVDAPRTGGVDPPIGVVVVVAAAPRFFFPVAPPSPGRGVFFAATMSCVVPASTETTTRERERERERERDVRSFKTPGEGSSAPSSSSSSSSSSASSSSFQSSALPRENNNALSKKNPILFFLS